MKIKGIVPGSIVTYRSQGKVIRASVFARICTTNDMLVLDNGESLDIVRKDRCRLAAVKIANKEYSVTGEVVCEESCLS